MLKLFTLPLLMAVLLVAGCGDTNTSRYKTRADAEADRLFERGWLPGLIPRSSHDIKTKNNLDTNTSEGEFSFAPGEAEEFENRLRRMNISEVSGSDQVRFLERNYHPRSYSDEDSQWTFFINSEKGHCEYRMEPTGESRQRGQVINFVIFA